MRLPSSDSILTTKTVLHVCASPPRATCSAQMNPSATASRRLARPSRLLSPPLLVHIDAHTAQMDPAQIRRCAVMRRYRHGDQPHMYVLKAKKLTTIDCWDIRRQSGVWTAAVILRKRDLAAWLAEPLPATISLPPETADDYRVHWDSEVKDLTSARSRFSELPGYAGIILEKPMLVCA